jgi:hypothetical protein
VSDRNAAGSGECEVVAPPRWRNPFDQGCELAEVRLIDALGAAEGEVEPVWDQSEMSGKQVKFIAFLRRSVEIVVGRYFKEIDLSALAEQVSPEGRTEAEAGSKGCHV